MNIVSDACSGEVFSLRAPTAAASGDGSAYGVAAPNGCAGGSSDGSSGGSSGGSFGHLRGEPGAMHVRFGDEPGVLCANESGGGGGGDGA